MPIPGGFFGKFFNRTISDAAGYGIGGALQSPLEPLLAELRQKNWEGVVKSGGSLAPDAYTLAEGVAQGQVDESDARKWASQNGIGPKEFTALIAIANVGPGIAAAFELWRRGIMEEPGFRRALKRLGLEQEWIDKLTALKDRLLSPAELANARQQGYITEARQKDESDKQGVTDFRAEVLFLLAGLPPGPETMQSAANRGFATRAEFDKAIVEGHTKIKYTDLLWQMREAVLSAQEYASARLRKWVTAEESYAGGALTGHTKEQMDLLFLNRGRPASPTQMWRAWARKATGPRGVPASYEDHAKAIAISDIRPEYAELLWEIRFNYPPLFQLNRLVASGAIDADTAADWAHKALVAPEVVTALHTMWSQGAATKADTHEAKAQTQLWGTLHRAYMAGDATETVVRAKLPQAGVSTGAVNGVVATWNHEREVVRQRLTPTQVKKAWKGAVTNPLTGVPWTLDDALAELLSRGWSSQDAQTFLAE